MQATQRIGISLLLTGATTVAGVVAAANTPVGAAAGVKTNIALECRDSAACVRLINWGAGVALSVEAASNDALRATSHTAVPGLPNAEHVAGAVVGNDRSQVAKGLNSSAGVVGLGGDGLGVLGISRRTTAPSA